MAIGKVNTGGGGSGGTLVVTGVAGDTITATKDGKTYSRTFNSAGKAVFRGLATGTWALTMTNGSQTVTRNVTITADYSLTMAYFTATITVTYPANSTCTCSDGVTTLTDSNTGETEKTVIFTVPNTGNWVISCTDGTESTSETVSITVDGQTVTVKLTYFDGTIYDAGTVSPYVELNMISNPSSMYNVAYGANALTFEIGTGKGAGFLCAKVDVTNYSTLKVSHTGRNSGSGPCNAAISESGEVDYDVQPDAKTAFNHMNANVNTVSLDISGFAGECYVGVWDHSWGNTAVDVTVHKIWIE